MSEKVRKKQPEIPQPKPDIILPKNDGTAAVEPSLLMQPPIIITQPIQEEGSNA